ncbi:MAG: ATP-binding cassette domain-containing protein [Acidobacteriota bacterium]
MIVVQDLRKLYDRNVAVDKISFTARPGEIFGLLGPNGAGKTTTISIISGLLLPSSGSVMVNGRPISPTAAAVKAQLGVVPQETALYQDLNARENLRFWGSLYGLGGAELKSRVQQMLEQLGLTGRAGEPVKNYSGGMKRRLNLGLGLVHDPKVVLLDEPTVGVDPQARLNILESIRDLASKGKTVLYTTHYLQEAEELCDRIAIMDHGRILAEGTVGELKKRIGEGNIVTVKGGFHAQALRDLLAGNRQVDLVSLEDHHAMLSLHDGMSPAQLLQDLMTKPLDIEEISVREASLEQVFLKLTGGELRD